MFIVAETKNTLATFLLLPRNYTALYNKLKTLLSQEEYLLFARPDGLGDATNWSTEYPGDFKKADIRSFSQLHEEDKDAIADQIEQLRTSISAKLSNQPEFAGILNQLFQVTAEQDIKALNTEQGLKPLLTQWGCKSAEVQSSIDPISQLIMRPRATSARVLLKVQYSDGEPAAGKIFYIEYLERNAKAKANNDGIFDRGRCRIGSQFEVYDLVEGQKSYVHSFEVYPEGGEYVVTFPLFAPARIQVKDQRGRPVSNAVVQVEIAGQTTTHTTDGQGAIHLEQLEVGKGVSFGLSDTTERLIETVHRKDNNWTLETYRPFLTSAIVKVVDEQGQAQANYPLQIVYDEKRNDADTGSEALLLLDQLESGKKITISSKKDPKFSKTFDIADGPNEFILEIVVPPLQWVNVKLIDHEDNAMPGVPIDFAYQNGKNSEITDDNGTCQLPFEVLTHKEKVAASIQLSGQDKKGKTWKKQVRKKFVFDKSQLEYTLKLSRRSRLWWLLLLLLLPLLLLIQCEKTVHVKTIDAGSGKPVAGVEVFFAYERSFLYDAGRLLPYDSIALRESSGPDGIAHFPKLRYSVYSNVFAFFSKALTFAVTDCYASDTLLPRFHGISDTLVLKLYPATVSMDFKVIDKEDGQPLPDAAVQLVSELNGIIATDSGTTGPDGRVVFNKVPKCGTLKLVKGETEGYLPDSLLNKTAAQLLRGSLDSARLLRLTPKKGLYSFFVIDCKSKQPIAGAKVQIEVDYNGRKTTKTKQTNVNGKGKGAEEDYLIAKIHLRAKAPYYKPGELPDWHPVKDFIDPNLYPDEKRTFCLEPEENCITFNNIDERSGKALSGVKNIVSIKNNGQTRVDTVFSDAQGKFPVCGIVVGDQISIIAQYPPDYEDNNTSVQNKDGIALLKGPAKDRTIPMKPKTVDLTFRTVDAAGTTLIDNATVNVLIDGIALSAPTSSGSGEFTVPNVPVTAQISIIASKQGYGTNSSKINQKPVKILIGAPQGERDIPLDESLTPCDQPIRASSGSSGEMYFSLGSKSYNFVLTYDMRTHPDRMTIYCGKGTGGKILFDEMLRLNDGSPRTIAYDASQCNGITVVIEPLNADDTSIWEFNISCPN